MSFYSIIDPVDSDGPRVWGSGVKRGCMVSLESQARESNNTRMRGVLWEVLRVRQECLPTLWYKNEQEQLTH